MKLPTPNPEVYRMAAQLMNERTMTFTCVAIGQAALALNEHVSMHQAQYRAMFGPWLNPEVFSQSFEPDYFRVDCDEIIPFHPYWNLDSTPLRQEWRTLALLFMADIVEQGV